MCVYGFAVTGILVWVVSLGSFERIVVERHGGTTVYSARGWCGFRELSGTFIVFGIIGFILGFMLLMTRQSGGFFDGFLPYEWMNTALSFVIAGAFDLGMAASLGLILLWLPYYLLYQLSPKKVWIEEDVLCHYFRLMWVFPRTRRIPFDRILEIEVHQSGDLYSVQAVYEMKLPRWLFVVLVHWNERLTQWSLTLINAIDSHQEAEWLANMLLEPMTDDK